MQKRLNWVPLACLCTVAAAHAGVVVEATWQNMPPGEVGATQTMYFSGLRAHLEDPYGVILYKDGLRYALDKRRKLYPAPSTRQSLMKSAQEMKNSGLGPWQWKVTRLDQSRTIGSWTCQVYDVSQETTKKTTLVKRLCVVGYDQLPNGEEVRNAVHAITWLNAPCDGESEPGRWIVEQPAAVESAVNGFVVAMRSLRGGSERELVVRSWHVEDTPAQLFTVPADYDPDQTVTVRCPKPHKGSKTPVGLPGC